MANRKIIHIDMDAFFASVEQRDFPELRGKPIAVGGGGMRGVVAAASYEARKFGVRSALPSVTAKRLCPDLIFVRHRFEVYKAVSAQIREIFREYTDLVEPLSLDEAFLDVTENKPGIKSAIRIAMEIRQKIKEQTQLTASAGVSINKFLAKVASDINKPDGMKVILPDEALAFLETLPIEKFFGIGKVTAAKMKKLGIFNGKDLKKHSEIELNKWFGKSGIHYYKMVRAIDNRPVKPHRIRKSIGAERTFRENLKSFEEMWQALVPISEKVFHYMKEKENFGRTLTLKMKKPDFQILTRSKTYTFELNEKKDFLDQCKNLLANHWSEAGEVRLLGVSMSNLHKEHQIEGTQLKLKFSGE
ncbi:MAG: DNA polymerase IV [Saprospiraceae bacterium]|nr:DNA polymerase IV [Saprospiraceae bacterium]